MPAILPDLTQKTPDELIALIHSLAANRSARGLTLKVSTKGALCVYGLGRFPVTLYRSQWERLLAEADAIRKFITTNSASLTTRDTD